MKKLRYTFKTDTLFKMLFVKYLELLKELVAELLGIPLDCTAGGVFRVRGMGGCMQRICRMLCCM